MFEGKIGIIWTLDRICKWNCDYCCVDAYCVTNDNNIVSITSNNFNYTEPIVATENKNIYQQGQDILVKHGLSLSLEDKIKILNSLQGANIEIGFSGGDFLLNRENLKVVQLASKMFGKENIGITATGVGMRAGHVEDYLEYIGQLDFTFDNTDLNDENHQQPGYNDSNLQAFKKIVEECRAKKVITQALIPISNTNKSSEIITELYSTLKQAGVDKLYLMRTFPVGRGFKTQVEKFSPDEYRLIINKYYELEKDISGPSVNIMCALKYLFPEKWDDPCTFLKSTIDITSTGDLIADAFAYGLKGEPLLKELIFGNLKENRFTDLINSPKIKALAKRIHENKGHCKVIAYINNQTAGIDGFFGETDPLYSRK
jgi:MoaA/NifB/PqqE/SkfB family radical SAM enzyme